MQSVHVRQTTLTDYTSKVRRHIIKELGEMRMDIYAKVKYNKPEELFDVVNQALHPSGTADNAAG